MPCYKPLAAFKLADGGVVFSQLGRYDIVGDCKLPCGQCIGCRLDRSREWAVRCLHEAKMHEENSFVTLTYDDARLPTDGSLDYEHFQLFMKRLRKRIGVPVRFFMCGEYGELTNRPHYHAVLFGYQFKDLMYWGQTGGGYPNYRSALLDEVWGKGFCTVGSVSKQSAGYVARYCLKKVVGDRADAHYNGREPEFAHMSLKPGIGAGFFKKFASDILPCDYVVCEGYKIPVPKYYDKLFEKDKGDIEDVKWERERFAKKHVANNSPERLAVREEVKIAQIRALKRNTV